MAPGFALSAAADAALISLYRERQADWLAVQSREEYARLRALASEREVRARRT
jgi:hypothetical protein